ncbi:MAG: hypothetical protein J2P48_03530 [Alphaproteobacteria bacterium]|nr:hypothetical protein [Alphaproteobacteria bacterium]
MRGVAIFVLFGLVAYATGQPVTSAKAASEQREWQTATGKQPSKNELAAVMAACEDRAKSSGKAGTLESCLADYGLRRVQ